MRCLRNFLFSVNTCFVIATININYCVNIKNFTTAYILKYLHR